VGLYTRQSLYVMLVGFNASTLLVTAGELEDDTSAGELVVGGAALTAVAFLALMTLLRRYPALHPLPWRPLAELLVAAAAFIVVAEVTFSGDADGAAAIVVAASLTVVFAVLPGRAVLLALTLGSALLLFATSGRPPSLLFGAGIALFFAFTMRASLWLLAIVQDLDETGRVKAQLAVAEERLRFSRDVHDVLGRRLSTIAVQAELAATLAQRGDERAADRMLEVRGVAHEALREARELARGYRPTDLGKELEGARSLLNSAGIDVHLDVDGMPRAWHEAAGWIVREAVTNVLRHSSASAVRITYADDALRVDNDGARAADAADGSGLRSLRERLTPLGATLDACADGTGHWIVTARLPGSGPLSATTRETP
jgi:two-component system sensor histidine kinase DesK